jgi:predicted nucleic acid-binding protein
MSPVICDTNVFIRLFAGDTIVANELVKIGSNNILLPNIVAMELYSGMANKTEMQQMVKKLKHYNILHINQISSEKSLELLLQFRLNHTLQIPDALIGGMAIAYNLELYTYNQKDFKFMPGIRLYPLPD